MAIGVKRLRKFTVGMTNKNRYLFVWGLVRYDDGFGYRRFNRFCHRYNLAAERDLQTRRGQGRYQEGANEAD